MRAYVCASNTSSSPPDQVVWPCLAVIGGLDSGLYLGRPCQVEGEAEGGTGTIVSTPDSDQKVAIQDQVTASTAEVKKRSVSTAVIDFHLEHCRWS